MGIPPSGITPAASFELAGFAAQLPAPAILADEIDPETGDFASLTRSRAIADGMVLYLTKVERGSGAGVLNRGHRLREVRHVDEQAPELIESHVREALSPAVESGTIRFESIGYEVDDRDGTQTNGEVRFKDLLAPRKDADRRLTFSP